jgi:hypothetical protein
MAPCDSERCDSVELRGVLHLGFTNATAFSLTGVVPLGHRAKYAMLL